MATLGKLTLEPIPKREGDKLVQVRGIRLDADGVVEWVVDELAQYWTIYRGHPGDWDVLADFYYKDDALTFARSLCVDGFVLDDQTFTQNDCEGSNRG